MVDVGGKPVTQRTATAEAFVRMNAATHASILAGDLPKGDVLGTARIAGIMAAKRTHEAIPMCHPLAIDSVKVEFETDVAADSAGRAGIRVLASVKCTGRTGVEMEALHAAAVAALTIYDMAKAVEKGMEIAGLKLLAKTGGKSGDWKA
ncbi:MAG: cyclic pyranopterin monophosphate synthase MoaC [Planctomycetes bacterium]|nr:cyclic pyranopterin monophosphate synthase MoaC [Planctomycetota bacterium]